MKHEQVVWVDANQFILVYKNGKRIDPPPAIISAPAIIITTAKIVPKPFQGANVFEVDEKTTKTLLLFNLQKWNVTTQTYVDDGSTATELPPIVFNVTPNGQISTKCFPPH